MKHLFYILLLFISNSIFAQNKVKETYTVYINYPDYTVKANVYSEPKKISTKDTLTYYWYSSNKIFHTQGGFDGKLFNGSFTSFYLSSNLKEKGEFKNGLKTGAWNAWFENGKIREITSWRKGIKSGLYKQFDEQGNQLIEGNYKNGKLNGSYTEYAGNKVKSEKKYKNGKEVIVAPKEKKVKEEKDPKSEQKDKKTFKEKMRSFFKKKDTTGSPAKAEEPKENKPEKKKKERKAKADKNEVK